MTLLYLLSYWYVYSKFYILGSLFVTTLFNHTFKKLWLSPLLVNAISVLVFGIGMYIGMIKDQEISYSLLNVYLPVVFFSIVMNLIIFAYRKIKTKIKER